MKQKQQKQQKLPPQFHKRQASFLVLFHAVFFWSLKSFLGGQSVFEPSPKFEVEDQPEWEDPPTQPDSPDPEEVCPSKMGDSPPPWDDPPTKENHDIYGNHDLENPDTVH